MKKSKTLLIAAIFAGLISLGLTACEKSSDGPMETAGKHVDNAASNVKDAVTPDGPAEKAGEKIDNATNAN